MKKIAVFEVEFDVEDMIDKESLKYWQNDLLKYMQEVYEDEGLGIFSEPLKLVELKEKK